MSESGEIVYAMNAQETWRIFGLLFYCSYLVIM